VSRPQADIIFVNGAVYTVDAARRWASAVAVAGGRIAAVGTDAEVRELAGRPTEIVDLGGMMLLPGFQDSHIHPPPGGLEMLRCNLSDAYALPEYTRIVREYAREHPEDPWILGGGWSMDVFPGGAPRADVLDDIVPERPALLSSRDGHSVWVNTRALELAGITGSTPDPADGRIERLPDGTRDGTLHEGAMHLVDAHVPETTQAEWDEGLRVAQTYLHSLGITA